jgi:hypothetical protein
MCHFEFNEESYNQFSPRGRRPCENEQCVAGPVPGREWRIEVTETHNQIFFKLPGTGHGYK